MKPNALLAVGAGIIGLLGLFYGKEGMKKMDTHKKKLEELRSAASFARDPETIANLNLHASLLVSELLVDVKQVGGQVVELLKLWDIDMQQVRAGTAGEELTKIRELLQKAFAPESEPAAEPEVSP